MVTHPAIREEDSAGECLFHILETTFGLFCPNINGVQREVVFSFSWLWGSLNSSS